MSKNFTQFDLKTQNDLKLGDYFVGYKDDGSEEFRTTVSSLTGFITSVQGIQGTQGKDGLFAGQGTQGVQGISNQGVQGAQGLQGLNGLFAGQGAQGIQGIIGFQGIQGIIGVQGRQGSQGIQGLSNQGVQGAIGFQGLQGLQGLQGMRGIKGDTGTSVRIINTIALTPGNEVAELQSIYPGAIAGDGVINSNTGDLWVSDGSSDWVNVGKIVGPQGGQGVQGISIQGTQGLSNQGIQGLQGASIQGLQGAQGLSNQGVQGLQGTSIQGLQGTQSLQGAQGLSNQGVQGLQGTSIQGTQGISSTTPVVPCIRAIRNLSQIILDNTETTFLFNVDPEFNTDTSVFSLDRNLGSTLSKIRISQTGVYLVNCKLNCNNYSYDDFLRIAVNTNGTSVDTASVVYHYLVQARTAANSTVSDSAVYNGSTLLKVDTAPLWVSVSWYRETSPQPASIGGSTVVSPDAYRPFFEIIKLS